MRSSVLFWKLPSTAAVAKVSRLLLQFIKRQGLEHASVLRTKYMMRGLRSPIQRKLSCLNKLHGENNPVEVTFLKLNFSFVTWKRILILSTGATTDLATMPANPPATTLLRVMMTSLRWCFTCTEQRASKTAVQQRRKHERNEH